jgi:hypothetical protein
MSYVACPKCGELQTASASYCTVCGAGLKEPSFVQPAPAQPYVARPAAGQSAQPVAQPPAQQAAPYAPSTYSAGSYAGLRSMAALCSALGWLLVIGAVVGVLVGMVVLFSGDGSAAIELAVIFVFVVMGGLGFLVLRVIAEGISVFLDIEANTRQTAIGAQRIVSLLEQRPR